MKNRRRFKWYQKLWNWIWRAVLDLLLIFRAVAALLGMAYMPLIVGYAFEIVSGIALGGHFIVFFVGLAIILFVVVLIGWLSNCWKRGNEDSEN